MMRFILALTALSLVAPYPASVAGAQAAASSRTTDPRAGIREARALLDSGDFRRAESLYVLWIPRIPAGDTALAATAYFGRAFATQQRLARGDSAGGISADTVLAAYRTAWAINPRLQAAATNNAALMFSALGERDKAIELFSRASEGADKAARAGYQLRIARENEARGDAGAARDQYRELLREDSSLVEAREGWFRSMVPSSEAGFVLGAAERWRKDSASAAFVADAMIGLLLRDVRPNPNQAETALLYLAEALPVARVGPPVFAVRMRDGLDSARQRWPAFARGIQVLLHAYEEYGPKRHYDEPGQARWWRSGSRRAAAWSTVLRSLGDWHAQRHDLTVAASFYEAAIGRNAEGLMDRTTDRKALVPLALIYAQSDRNQSLRLQTTVEEFTGMLFNAKAAAYERQDAEEIRDLHTALGTYYASRGIWQSDDAANAEFQLSRMRGLTRQLARTDRRVSDPPDLLLQLGLHYQRTARPERARELFTEVRSHYAALGRPAAADVLYAQTDWKMRGARPWSATDTTAAWFAESGCGTQPRVAFSGKVLRDGRPVEGAVIAITADTAQYRVTSAADGSFSATVPTGSMFVDLSVSALGLQPTRQTVSPCYMARIELPSPPIR